VPYVLHIGALLAAIASAGLLLVPEDWAVRRMLSATSDPASIAARNFRSALTPTRINTELKAALDSRDKYLADSFVELARQETVALDPQLRQRYDSETGGFAAPVVRFWDGLWYGKCSSFEAFAGARITDLVFGDVRDLYTEAATYRNGGTPDLLVVGLATLGIVTTGGVPFHVATSMVKGLAKTGRLSQSFRGELTNAIASGFDTQAVLKALPDTSWWGSLPSFSWENWWPDVSWPLFTEKLPQLAAALRSGVHFEKLGVLNQLARNLETLISNAGVCATQDALTLAHSAADLERLARVAEQRKGATAAMLKLLGRDALALPVAQLTLGQRAAACSGADFLAVAAARA
jgi:hypothetical protein